MFCKKNVPSFWFVTYLYQYRQVFIICVIIQYYHYSFSCSKYLPMAVGHSIRLATLPFWHTPIIFWVLSEFLLLLNERRITVHFPCFCPGISQLSREFHRILKILKVLTSAVSWVMQDYPIEWSLFISKQTIQYHSNPSLCPNQ